MTPPTSNNKRKKQTMLQKITKQIEITKTQSQSRVKPSSRLPTPITRTSIVDVLWDFKKNGYADSTIKTIGKSLNKLANYCNL